MTVLKTFLMLALLLPMLACKGGLSSKTDDPEASQQNSVNTADPEQYWKLPSGLSNSDQKMIRKWFEANEECVGGIDEKVYHKWCAKRSELQDRLKKLGWCWGSPMSKSAADDDWHHCGSYDTDNMSNADALVAKGLSFLQQDAAPAENSDRPKPDVVDPHARDLYDEKYRIKSPVLQAYENAIEPVAHKMGLADILATCGIRGKEWHQRMLDVLNARLHSPSNEEMARRLTPADAKSALSYKQTVIDSYVSLYLGGQPKDSACRDISKMTFAADDGAFAP